MGTFLFGTFLSMVAYSIVAYGVFKIIQIATDMSEIKEILKDIRRNSEAASALPSSESNLARALNARAYAEIEEATHSEQQR